MVIDFPPELEIGERDEIEVNNENNAPLEATDANVGCVLCWHQPASWSGRHKTRGEHSLCADITLVALCALTHHPVRRWPFETDFLHFYMHNKTHLTSYTACHGLWEHFFFSIDNSVVPGWASVYYAFACGRTGWLLQVSAHMN